MFVLASKYFCLKALYQIKGKFQSYRPINFHFFVLKRDIRHIENPKLNKLKFFFGLTGWLLVIGGVGVAHRSLSHPEIVDGMLWRYEILENNPTVGQRIFEKRSQIQNVWEDKFIADGAIIFIGDSHLRLLPQSVIPNLYNFAIGGQTIGRMVPRLEQFRSLQNAALIVVNGGENDLSEDRSVTEVLERWRNFLQTLRKQTKSPVLCIGLPESKSERVHKEMIAPLNEGIAQLCAQFEAEFLPINVKQGKFDQVDLSDDKMHLSRAAMKIMLTEIENRAAKVIPKN